MPIMARGSRNEDRRKGLQQLELLIRATLDLAAFGNGKRAALALLTHEQPTAAGDRLECCQPGEHPALQWRKWICGGVAIEHSLYPIVRPSSVAGHQLREIDDGRCRA